jgi:hypothetical protein
MGHDICGIAPSPLCGKQHCAMADESFKAFVLDSLSAWPELTGVATQSHSPAFRLG